MAKIIKLSCVLIFKRLKHHKFCQSYDKVVTELRFKDMKLDSIQLHYHYLSTLQEGTASANPQTETLRRVTPLRKHDGGRG